MRLRTVLIGFAANTSLPAKSGLVEIETIPGVSGGREREFVFDGGFCLGPAVRTSGLTGLGAGAKRIVDDGFDGSRAASAFHAAAKAAIDMLGMAQCIVGATDGAPDIVVADDVAGTDDHENVKDLTVTRDFG